MKKKYEKPCLDVERYELNASIASNCVIVVSNGPALGVHEQCEDYTDPFGTFSVRSTGTYNVNFYDDTGCDCYYTAGDSGYWMS